VAGVTTTVGLTSVPVQVNQAPGSLNLGSTAVESKNSNSPTKGCAPASGTPAAGLGGSTGAGVTRT
jgi:hypothetical protein